MASNERDIRILLVEDTPADVELIERELRNGGLLPRREALRRVESRAAFLQELETCPPDLILSDHGLPSFDGFTALALAQERRPEVPFILVTESPGVEDVIQAFERGAADCVLKSRLSGLTPAVRRALHHAEEQQRRRAAEVHRELVLRELGKAAANLRSAAANGRDGPDERDRFVELILSALNQLTGPAAAGRHRPLGLLPICAHCKKIRNPNGCWEPVERYFRRQFDVAFTHGLCPDCVPVFFPGSLVGA